MYKELAEITKHYGVEHQRLKLIEELSELIRALSLYHNDESYGNRYNIQQEMADCYILMAQVAESLNLKKSEIEFTKELKIERTMMRIKDEDK
jgi:hypothetical protein